MDRIVVSSESSSQTLTIDYLEPEIFEAHSVICCLLIEFSEQQIPSKMELWTPHSFALRVHLAFVLCLLGFRIFHDICQSRDAFLGQRTIVLPQFVHVQTSPTGVLLTQPNSDAFGRTEE